MINFNQIFTPEYYPYWISLAIFFVVLFLTIKFSIKKMVSKEILKSDFSGKNNRYLFIPGVICPTILFVARAKKLYSNVAVVAFGTFFYVAGLLFIIVYLRSQHKQPYEDYFKSNIFDFSQAPLRDGIFMVAGGMSIAVTSLDLPIPFLLVGILVYFIEDSALKHWLKNTETKNNEFYVERPKTIFSLQSIKNLKNVHHSKR